MYFKFDTEIDALNFCATVNEGENIPKTQTSTTKTYCSPLNNQNIFYVIADDITSKYTTLKPVEMPPWPLPATK